MRVEVQGGRLVKQWCSPACKVQATRRRRILMIANALRGDRATRLAALKVLGPEIERAESAGARRAERIAQQGGNPDE